MCSAIFLQFIGKFWYLWISLYLNSAVFIFICAKIRKYSQSTLANNRHKFLLLLQFSLRMDYRHLWFVNCFCLRGWSLLPFFLQFFSSWRLKYELLHSVDKFFINYVHWMADLIGKMSENYAVNKVFIMNMHRKSPFQLFQYFEPLILETWLHSSE